MLQRNPHPYPLDVPAVPATVQPGEAVDWPVPISGFETVSDDLAQPTTSSSRKKPAAASAPSGEEPTQ